MRTLSDLTTAELTTLKAQVGDAHRDASRRGVAAIELARWWHAIDDELDRRGA